MSLLKWKTNEQLSLKNGPHKKINFVWKQKTQFSDEQDSLRIIGSYKGDWLKDQRNGFGEQVYQNGDKYIGYWKDNKREGKGCLYVLNEFWQYEKCYSGEWKNNKRNGQGIQFFKNEDWYEGTWDNDQLSGLGRFISNDSKYIGEHRNNKKNGFGIELNQDGAQFQGFWNDGLKDGFGYCYFSSKEKILIGFWRYHSFIYGEAYEAFDFSKRLSQKELSLCINEQEITGSLKKLFERERLWTAIQILVEKQEDQNEEENNFNSLIKRNQIQNSNINYMIGFLSAEQSLSLDQEKLLSKLMAFYLENENEQQHEI